MLPISSGRTFLFQWLTKPTLPSWPQVFSKTARPPSLLRPSSQRVPRPFGTSFKSAQPLLIQAATSVPATNFKNSVLLPRRMVVGATEGSSPWASLFSPQHPDTKAGRSALMDGANTTLPRYGGMLTLLLRSHSFHALTRAALEGKCVRPHTITLSAPLSIASNLLGLAPDGKQATNEFWAQASLRNHKRRAAGSAVPWKA